MLIRTAVAIALLTMIGCSGRGTTTVAAQASSSEAVSLSVDSQPSVQVMQRIGVNLGSWTSWGAEQLAANVIKNPGFEGVIDRALAVVKTSTAESLTVAGDQERPDGFWQGATIDVRSGLAAGESARVIAYHRDPSTRQGTFTTEPSLLLASGDLISLTRLDDSTFPTQWWTPQAQVFCGNGPARPGSAGRRSFRVCPSGGHTAEVNSYLDGIGERAGKLLPIDGKWQLSFWYRNVAGNALLQTSLRRQPSSIFLDRQLAPSPAWQQAIIGFDAHDVGPPGILQLQFLANGNGEIDLDDVSLEHTSDGKFPFRAEVTAVLEQLHPAYLRDWQGQLGDTVENRLLPPFGRRASRYRSGRREDSLYGYSIPEFLQLCGSVSASPWLVLPTTASDSEFRELGTYLKDAQARFHFREVLVEFGNENWNPLFATAGISDPSLHGKVSTRAFSILRNSAQSGVPLRTVINAQFANPQRVEKFAALATSDIVAVAPYFAFNLPANADAAQTGKLLFTPAKDILWAISAQLPPHRELAVYEVNLHTVGGDAPSGERDAFVLSSASGTALAQRLIEAMEAGVRRQCVYSLSGYDTFTQHGRDLVKLFGLVRDLGAGPKLRASGLAVRMLNQVIQPEVHEVRTTGGRPSNGITAIAFHADVGWSAAITSSRDEDAEVGLRFPAEPVGALPRTVMTLSAGKALSGGEQVTDVTGPTTLVTHIDANTRCNCISIHVPARGFVALAAGL